MAEADGNRTRLTEMLGHYGFQDSQSYVPSAGPTTASDLVLVSPDPVAAMLLVPPHSVEPRP